jgi:hypothetical protein
VVDGKVPPLPVPRYSDVLVVPSPQAKGPMRARPLKLGKGYVCVALPLLSVV